MKMYIWTAILILLAYKTALDIYQKEYRRKLAYEPRHIKAGRHTRSTPFLQRYGFQPTPAKVAIRASYDANSNLAAIDSYLQMA